VFRQLEEEDTARPFKPPEFERGGMSTNFSRLDQELPSVRIERMRCELDELQKELLELEREEIPTRMAVQA